MLLVLGPHPEEQGAQCSFMAPGRAPTVRLPHRPLPDSETGIVLGQAGKDSSYWGAGGRTGTSGSLLCGVSQALRGTGSQQQAGHLFLHSCSLLLPDAALASPG